MKLLLCLFVCCFQLFPFSLRASSEHMIDVLIDESSSFLLGATGPFRLISKDNGKVLLQGNYCPDTVVSKGQKNQIFMEGLSTPFGGGIDLESAQEGVLSFNKKKYRGTFSVRLNPKNKKLQVFNHVSENDYLKGVVGKEIPYYWPQSVLKAQAISARTFLYFRLYGPSKKKFLRADTLSQMYAGMSVEMPSTNEAVDQSKGFVLLFKNRLFPTFYHSRCGGQTESDFNIWAMKWPPLKGKICPCGSLSENNFWTVKIHRHAIEEMLNKVFDLDEFHLAQINILKKSPSGRVMWMEFVDQLGNKKSLSGNTVRMKLGSRRLKSTKFTCHRQGVFFCFQGFGWGHGVGLCQWGAKIMAENNKASAEKILHFYFPNTRLKRYFR